MIQKEIRDKFGLVMHGFNSAFTILIVTFILRHFLPADNFRTHMAISLQLSWWLWSLPILGAIADIPQRVKRNHIGEPWYSNCSFVFPQQGQVLCLRFSL